MPRHVPLLMLLVLLFGLVLMRESRQMPGLGLEARFVTWLATNTPREVSTAPLALVEIDDSSLAGEHAWPWSPLDYALFLEAALQFQPSVIAIEPVLDWDERKLPRDVQLKQPQYEKILHDRILRAPKTLLAAELGFPEDPDVIPPLQPVMILRQIVGDIKALPEFTTVGRQPKEELRLAAKLGFVNVPGGVSPVRRVPLLFSYRGQVVPSFVLQALMLWFKLTPDDVKVELGSQISLGSGLSVPIDAAGGMLVDFKSPLERVGFDDLLLAVHQAEAGQQSAVSREILQDKLVLLARTDANSQILNLPFGRKGSPGELFAAAIATVQNRSFIRQSGIWSEGCVILAAMLLSWCMHGRSRRFAAAFTATVFVVYLLVALSIFKNSLIAMPFVLPAGLTVLLVLFRLFLPGEKAPAAPAEKRA